MGFDGPFVFSDGTSINTVSAPSKKKLPKSYCILFDTWCIPRTTRENMVLEMNHQNATHFGFTRPGLHGARRGNHNISRNKICV